MSAVKWIDFILDHYANSEEAKHAAELLRSLKDLFQSDLSTKDAEIARLTERVRELEKGTHGK